MFDISRIDTAAQLLTDVTLKATVLLVAACVAVCVLRRSSAAVKHRLWSLTLLGVLMLPLLSWALPAWQFAVLPLDTQPAPLSVPSAASAPLEMPEPRRDDVAIAPTTHIERRPQSISATEPAPSAVDASSFDPTPSQWLVGGWLLGGLVSLAFLARGWWRARAMIRRSHVVADEQWQHLLTSLQRRLSLPRRVELREGADAVVPLTWGIVRPVVLIPSSSNEWSDQLKQSVLLHELLHIQRGDIAFQLVGRLACVAYWFHPLAWFALHRLRHDREQACDDAVVHTGEKASDYAGHLLEIARHYHYPLGVSLAIEMARPGKLERRLQAMFDERRSHRPMRRSLAVMLLMLIVGVTTGVAVFEPVRASVTPDASDATPTRIWYILSQTDTDGLLHGMAERLGQAIVPSQRTGKTWEGVSEGGSVTVDIEVQGDAEGEIFIGFFEDPQWWIAEPKQVRRVPGPGKYTLENVIPGQYCVGAMIGAPPDPSALGVYDSWPNRVKISSGETTAIRVLISSEFEDRPAGVPGLKEGFAAKWEDINPAQMITVRTLDQDGEPMPFCRVTFVDRDDEETREFHDVGTDHLGFAYCDEIDATFSLCVQRFDIDADSMASRWHYKKIEQLHNAQDRPQVTIKWEPFPVGSGKLAGRVYDHHGKPLTEYYLTLTRIIGEIKDWSDSESFAIKVPVTDPDGRYEISELAAGTYWAMVRHFDYPAYVYHISYENQPHVTIPDDGVQTVLLDIEVEAKELWYGRAVFDDGSPPHSGVWSAVFERDPDSPWGGDSFAMSIKPDGSFRVALSRHELSRLKKNSKGLIAVTANDPRPSKASVHINDLSLNPQKPTTVVLPNSPDDPNKPAVE